MRYVGRSCFYLMKRTISVNLFSMNENLYQDDYQEKQWIFIKSLKRSGKMPPF